MNHGASKMSTELIKGDQTIKQCVEVAPLFDVKKKKGLQN